jgi:putative ABC transport system permease protein
VRAWSEVWVRIRALLRRSSVERELEEELAFHLERETDKNIARGMAPVDARREAYRRFGGVERHRERTREAWGVRGLEGLGRDARLGLRRMARSPGFTLVATLTLALGIGGTSAMFAVVNTLLLRPLPYPEDDRLVWIESEAMITADNLQEWRSGVGSIEKVGAFRIGSRELIGRGGARVATFMPVSDEYLEVLGARPVLGRLWSVDENRAGAPPVALVSDRIWREELGGGELSGRTVTLGGVRYEVVGVLAADFHNMGFDADLWVPLAHASGSYSVVGLLRPGATVGGAQREVDALLERLEPQPGSDLFGKSARVESLRERFAGDVRTPVLVLFAAAGFVLLLSLANLANLLLSRSAVRARELSVRSALGAARGVLLRQSLVESAVLALTGGTMGLLLAHGSVRVMLALAPPALQRSLVVGVRIDPLVLAFTFALTLSAAGLAGVVPALAGARAGSWSTRTRSTTSRRDRRIREALVAAEVAVALVMLIGTALLVRTYWTLRPASPGFELEDRLVAPLTLPGRVQIRDNLGPPPEAPANAELIRRLVADIEQRAAGIRAAAVPWVPLSGSYTTVRVVDVDGRAITAADGSPLEVVFNSATPAYLDVMGIRVTQGRGLAGGDVAGAPHVIVLSVSAARFLWPEGQDPIGRRVTLDPYGADRPRPPDAAARPPAGPQILEFTVVGLVADIRASGEHTRPRPETYVSYWQVPWSQVHVVVHAPPAAGVTAADLRAAVAALDPTVPVGDVTTVEAIAGTSVAQTRYEMTLMGVFGALAAILAVIGCYGVMAYSVSQRTREIGVRMALGATRRSVTKDVLARGSAVLGVGLAIGLILAAVLTRVLEGSLYGVSATDPATFAAAVAILAAATLSATWLPARRAAAIEPALTLRED